MPLTVRQIDAAKPKDRPYKLTDGQGLYLFVAPTGTKSWRANYEVREAGAEKSKQKTRTYGQYPALSLAEARRAHAGARDGLPAVETKPTFQAVARQWLTTKLPGLSNPKHKVQVENTLERFAYPKLGAVPMDKIERTLLVETVKAVQALDAKAADSRIETAHRVASRITAVFDYAVDEGILKAHPASHLTRVLLPRKVKKPMACIPKEEAGELLRAIDTYPEPVTRLGLLLVAHTFVRVNELLGFRSDELREDGAIWVVPEERVKGEADAKLPHVVPLSPQAQALVREAQAMSGCDLVLESPAAPGRPLSENTLLFALYRLGYKHRMTVHGFRSLASTVLNEESPFDKDVIERQLAHKETDDVRGAYNRAQYLQQRRELMRWWSDWLDGQFNAAAPAAHGRRAAG